MRGDAEIEETSVCAWGKDLKSHASLLLLTLSQWKVNQSSEFL